MVVLDTNVIIDHQRQPPGRFTFFKRIAQNEGRRSLALSILTVQELYEGKSTKEKNKEEDLLGILTAIRILPYTFEIAQKAGMIARDLKRSMEFPDAAIAATAIVNGAELYTLNKKHFKDIPKLEFYKL